MRRTMLGLVPTNSGHRLSRIIFCLLIFLLPIQTRKIFFTETSFYYGYHAFYNSWYVYLTDSVLLCLIIAWIWENVKFSRENTVLELQFSVKTGISNLLHRIYTRVYNDRIYQLFALFWLISAISLLFSRENTLGLYGLVKITEFGLFFAYLRENFISYPQKFTEKISFHRKVLMLVVISAVLQSILGIWQYFNQSSFGLKILGEEFLRPGIAGIAEFVSRGLVSPLSSQAVNTINIRAYGTFPHPNVFAGFLFLGLMITLYLLYTSRFSRENWVWGSSLIIIVFGLVVSFSRLAWGISFFGALAWLVFVLVRMRRNYISALFTENQSNPLPFYQPKKLFLIITLLVVSLGLNLGLFGQQIKDRLRITANNYQQTLAAQESVVNRAKLNEIAWRMTTSNPVFGAGVRSFVSQMDGYAKERLLPYMHQPVHNIYFLVSSETGFLGLLVFLLLLYYIVRRKWRNSGVAIMDYTLVVVFFGFLMIGLFDHYLWTIQQGSLMFWLTAGLVMHRKQKNAH